MKYTSWKTLRQFLSTVAIAASLSACGNMEAPNGLALTPGFSPGSLSGSTGSVSAARFESASAQQKGSALAQFAVQQASGGTGWCYSYVAQAIHKVYEPFLYGEHAYMAADQLAQSSHFTEVSARDLSGLPAGAVVVWEQGASPSGHISIADGQGREISDHIAPQMLSHYGGGNARVFLPR